MPSPFGRRPIFWGASSQLPIHRHVPLRREYPAIHPETGPCEHGDRTSSLTAPTRRLRTLRSRQIRKRTRGRNAGTHGTLRRRPQIPRHGWRRSWLAEILILVWCFSDEDPGLDSTVCQVATKAFIPWQGPLISNDKIKLSHLYRERLRLLNIQLWKKYRIKKKSMW